MGKVTTRIVIYAKDVMNITGRSHRASNSLLQKIRVFYNKSRRDFVTILEFCAFTNIREELVREYLVD